LILSENNREDTCISGIKRHVLVDVQGVSLPAKNPEGGNAVSYLNMAFSQNGYMNMLYI